MNNQSIFFITVFAATLSCQNLASAMEFKCKSSLMPDFGSMQITADDPWSVYGIIYGRLFARGAPAGGKTLKSISCRLTNVYSQHAPQNEPVRGPVQTTDRTASQPKQVPTRPERIAVGQRGRFP